MLIAHLVPGYFAASISARSWPSTWGKVRRVALWSVALGATFVPDLDVIYNTTFRHFVNHSLLWTHCLFTYMAVGMLWLLVWRIGRWPYAQTLLSLCFCGGISHLALDVISHGTPLFYPLSKQLIGVPSERVLQYGVIGYLTDPIFLLEPLLLGFAAGHWALTRIRSTQARGFMLAGLCGVYVVFSSAFVFTLPVIQRMVDAQSLLP